MGMKLFKNLLLLLTGVLVVRALLLSVDNSNEDKIENTYQPDDKYKSLIAQVIAGTTTLPLYTYTTGILRYKDRIHVGTDPEFQQQLLSTFHSSPIGGHS